MIDIAKGYRRRRPSTYKRFPASKGRAKVENLEATSSGQEEIARDDSADCHLPTVALSRSKKGLPIGQVPAVNIFF